MMHISGNEPSSMILAKHSSVKVKNKNLKVPKKFKSWNW